jgi:hypothetical protein
MYVLVGDNNMHNMYVLVGVNNMQLSECINESMNARITIVGI